MIRRLVILAAILAAALGVFAAPAGAMTVQPPAGLICQNIEGDRDWATCEVSQYLNGPFAPPPALRAPAWMVCRPFGDPWYELWNRDIYWGCGWSKVSGYQLVWAL